MHKDALPIEEPCTVDFDAMKRGEKSRFCGECKKLVHDVTKLSRSEATALFAAPSAEGLCVRYVYDELGHVVFADTFRDRPLPAAALLRKTAKSIATAALLAFPLSLTACMGAMQRPTPPAIAPVREAPSAPLPASDASADEATTSDAGAPLAR